MAILIVPLGSLEKCITVHAGKIAFFYVIWGGGGGKVRLNPFETFFF